MVDELSDEALVAAYELSQSPTTDAIWRGGFAASWEDAEESEERREAIEIYKVVGVDACPGSDQKTVHGRRVTTLSVREAREECEPGEATATQSVDV